MNTMKHILIVAPSFKVLGGVSNHYMGLHPYWESKVTYSTYGKRPGIPAIYCLIPDLILYVLKLIFCGVDIVIVNPTFWSYQIKRDGVYAWIAKLFGKKVVTMVHGWDWKMAEYYEKNPKWVLKTFGKSDGIFVLYSAFKDSLRRMGVTSPILMTTTKVSDKLLQDTQISRDGKIKEILYLARVEKEKGIIETLDCFQILQEKYPYLKLNICGDGAYIKEAKSHADEKMLKNVFFHGIVEGERLKEQLRSNDIYILASYQEGMPTSVLEAMAFGLPVVTRPVGGLQDFFENGKMGQMIESLDPKDFASVIETYIQDKTLTINTGIYNQEYALNHFLASAVTKRFEHDILSL
ncbi:MAG: glycosyltransferase family 4 protein [Bacteroidaceae bacterium]|nr:glycosyltransferase family 4 protein [Bacteroidaceae bacterium]